MQLTDEELAEPQKSVREQERSPDTLSRAAGLPQTEAAGNGQKALSTSKPQLLHTWDKDIRVESMTDDAEIIIASYGISALYRKSS